MIILLNSFIIPSAILISLLFTYAFAHFSRRGPWMAILLFFFIIFLVSWAGQLWIKPFGPVISGISLFPMLFTAVIFAILIIAMMPRTKAVTEEKGEEKEQSVFAIGMFFWLLIIVLIVAIAIGYYNIPAIPPVLAE